jgi:protein-tyrosine phosphatase
MALSARASLRIVGPVIDMHCHVLPGIDDGPQTIDGSLALARAAAAAGTSTVVATPHVSWRYPNDAETIARLVDELNVRLEAERAGLRIRPGAEIAMTRALDLSAGQLSQLHIGEGPWLLLEPTLLQPLTGLEEIVLELHHAGHRILLAHPERCVGFHRDPFLLEGLVNVGVLTSITAGSLVGRFGDHVRRFALRLVRDGLVHNVASDAHDHIHRPPGTARELERSGLGPLADWLTSAVPAAILNGEELPPRPVDVALSFPTERQPWWRRRRETARRRLS